ncbi:MAG TPA: hypothetical protein VMF09_12705 [Solirubrobacteraceae bacterium]|nr:hypothetical protein [Solirubrobacteraceae bacterium]
MPARAALATLILLAFPVSASARRASVDSDPVSEAVARAVAYWGGTPCGGSVAVVSSPSGEAPRAGANAPSPAGRRAAMWATWRTSAGTNLFTQPPATFSDCVVHINGSVWPNWLSDDREFPAFCKEMLHEYGHFEGHPDAGAAPGTIEYERPDLAHVPLCESYALVYGHELFKPFARERRRRSTRRRRAHRRRLRRAGSRARRSASARGRRHGARRAARRA